MRLTERFLNEFLQCLINKWAFLCTSRKSASKMKKPRCRCLSKKTYLRRIRRNWVISFNLIEERNNQQPQQQRHSAGVSEYNHFFSFSRYLRSSVTTAEPWGKKYFEEAERLVCSFDGNWKIFHVRIRTVKGWRIIVSPHKDIERKSIRILTELSEANVMSVIGQSMKRVCILRSRLVYFLFIQFSLFS